MERRRVEHGVAEEFGTAGVQQRPLPLKTNRKVYAGRRGTVYEGKTSSKTHFVKWIGARSEILVGSLSLFDAMYRRFAKPRGARGKKGHRPPRQSEDMRAKIKAKYLDLPPQGETDAWPRPYLVGAYATRL